LSKHDPPPMWDAENREMFDFTDEGVKLRDEAIARVDKQWFTDQVCQLIEKMDPGTSFTTDDLWDEMKRLNMATPEEPRAMGSAMTQARKRGLCEATREFSTARRKQAHKSPQRVWRRCGWTPG
jgi:hypothetical protein